MERKNVRLVGVAVALLAAIALGILAVNHTQGSSVGSPFTPPPIPISALGEASTVNQVATQFGSNFHAPTYLPAGASLSQVRIWANTAYLIYSDQNLSNLARFDTGAIIILITRDNTSYASALSDIQHAAYNTVVVNQGGRNTTLINNTASANGANEVRAVDVSGHSALGNDPFDYSPAHHIDGSLQWWSNGIHFTVIANLPLSTLVQIAQSMQT